MTCRTLGVQLTLQSERHATAKAGWRLSRHVSTPKPMPHVWRCWQQPSSREAPTMTADIELLPLPEALFETRSLRDLFNVAQMQGYARANVAHATAAKDAEIEALRAEVEQLNRILGRIVEGDGDSTLTIRAGTDAFAAARE